MKMRGGINQIGGPYFPYDSASGVFPISMRHWLLYEAPFMSHHTTSIKPPISKVSEITNPKSIPPNGARVMVAAFLS